MHIIEGFEVYILVFILAAIGVGFVSFVIISSIVKTKKYLKGDSKEDSSDEETLEEVYEEPEMNVIGAVVLGKQSIMWSLGKSHSLEFKVTFMTDNGETVEMNVPQDVYAEIYESQTGDLVTANGNFFYFGQGESVE